LTVLQHQPRSQHGDLRLLLRRRAPYLLSPAFGSSELHHIEDGGV
jgi:hypothetical protein